VEADPSRVELVWVSTTVIAAGEEDAPKAALAAPSIDLKLVLLSLILVATSEGGRTPSATLLVARLRVPEELIATSQPRATIVVTPPETPRATRSRTCEGFSLRRSMW
jgi:hypothetical protein